MSSFGHLLRFYRRRCQDPQRGGMLTQERLGELLGVTLGDAGYSGAAVSDWERDKSKINVDDRLVLVTLVNILHSCGGLLTPADADKMLEAGNYRALNERERRQVFPENDQPPDTSQTLSRKQVSSLPSSQPALTSTNQMAIHPPGQRGTVSRPRYKQLILLHKVNNFWVEGVLEQSEQESKLLELSLRSCDEVIEHPWQEIIGSARFDLKAAPRKESLFDLFTGSDRALLILGEPGAGKTTTLISLARDLIKRAVSYESEPIPVILNLASWVEQRHPLAKWVAEELTAKYQIPRRLAAKWVDDDDLVLLLDGLDEVPDRLRPRCIKVINQFRNEHGLTGITICSRSEEYHTAGVRLKLSGAVAVEPLSSNQIDDYLNAAGPRLASLKKAVNQDANLKQMARSPLMLSIMGQAYSYSQEDLAGILSSSSEAMETPIPFWRRHLFQTYVANMFQRRPIPDHFSPEQTKQWLGWLARKMFAHSHAHFLVEQLQPSWLPDRRWRWIYMFTTGFILGLVGGVIMWLFLQLLRESNPFLPAPLSSFLADFLQITQGRAEVFTLILANIVLGLVVALLQGYYFERQLIKQDFSEGPRRTYWRHLAVIGLVVGSLTIVTVSLVGLPSVAIVWGVAEVILFVTAARYIYGRSYLDEIRTVEALSWSWLSAAKGLATGLFFALIAEVLGKLIFEAPVTIDSALILGFGGFILGGLRGRRVEAKSRPNQGIVLSFRNSFIAASLSSLLIGLVTWLVRSPQYALLAGGLTFIIAGSLLGGNNVIKHYLVRTFLWIHGDIPWRYVKFLDSAASLTFLRKVGGSYIFLHRLLQSYFATLPLSTPRTHGTMATSKTNLEGSTIESQSI